jgi:hypothetical protein
MNIGMWVGCHVGINNANVGIMGVFYGYSFWMDRIVAMNVGIMGVFHGYSFWKDTIVAMNVGIYKGCLLWVLFWMNRILAMNVGM